MKMPTFESHGEGKRRMVLYEGSRFPEMTMAELEDYFLRCMAGAEEHLAESRRKKIEEDADMLMTLAAAGNALVVCRVMRQCSEEYVQDKGNRMNVLRFAAKEKA